MAVAMKWVTPKMHARSFNFSVVTVVADVGGFLYHCITSLFKEYCTQWSLLLLHHWSLLPQFSVCVCICIFLLTSGIDSNSDAVTHALTKRVHVCVYIY